MYQYSNAFGYSTNPETNEYLITFNQQYPILNQDGSIKELSTETVAQIYLSRAGVDALKKLLDEI